MRGVDKTWHTSFRLSKEAKKIVNRLADDYRVSRTDVMEMILAGKIDVPKVLAELKEQENEQNSNS